MPTLTERIRTDLTSSMKARDAARTSTLRMVQAALKNEQIDKGHELTDEEATAVVARAVKQRQDSIEQYRKGGREDLAAREEAEIAMLQDYLPQQLSETEVEAIVDQTIASTGATSKKDTGKVMKEIMASHRGTVDGRMVQEILAKKLT
ncbi:MAG: GatB/YqeY domain-containing protein [Thermoanaerobaculia bacterium]